MRYILEGFGGNAFPNVNASGQVTLTTAGTAYNVLLQVPSGHRLINVAIQHMNSSGNTSNTAGQQSTLYRQPIQNVTGSTAGLIVVFDVLSFCGSLNFVMGVNLESSSQNYIFTFTSTSSNRLVNIEVIIEYITPFVEAGIGVEG
jgi:hypothetical protein